MPRLEDLDPESRVFLQAFRCRSGGDPPWCGVKKPLRESRIALITTSGLIRRSDTPFDLANPAGDFSFREIPVDTAPSELTFSHVSTNWDRTGFAMDVNVVMPTDRVRELAREGVVGSLAADFYSFMGAIFQFEPLIEKSVPALVRRLEADNVDVAFLVPT